MAPKAKGNKGDNNQSKSKGKEKKDSDNSSGGKVKGAQQINVRHILCEKFSKQQEALQRLKDGAKFDDTAREFSEDKARVGGALGWKKRGDLEPSFEKIAFDLESSTLDKPKYVEAKTVHGYHIIMVEGRK
ncbi:BgTH12-01982 [Blumeria graminis f. sp. triticale]|uniref:Peptidyl-prolyl cis-trans isomerase n=1 Tax=Blumeria graminis f. sp. triticale TaxID=1689686 RepID=A0A9W4D041_BLUGR|nr:BgTH12-01982 [Blumeria graminis f. sp. triticale]